MFLMILNFNKKSSEKNKPVLEDKILSFKTGFLSCFFGMIPALGSIAKSCPLFGV